MGQRIPEKEIANFQFAELAKYRKQHKNNQQAGSLITRLPAFFYACKCHFSRGCSNEPPLNTPRACLKNHSRNLHAPLCGIFHPNSVAASLMTVFEQSHTWDELIQHFVDSYVMETDKKAVSAFYDRDYIAERLKGLETELSLECRITLNGEERWVRNVIIRGEIEDSEYAMIFLRDITEAKVESARHLQMAADNASMEQLIQSIVRLVDRFVVCDLENDRYESYNLNGQMIYKPLGFYHDFQMQVLEKYKTLEPLEAIDILIAPDNIRKKLKSENDIYKFEYCSLDEKTYKIASYIPLEWKNGKLEKVLLASMDVTQEKKAEIESRQALKEAYRSAENVNRAKTEFLSNMSHVLLCLDWLYLIDAAEVDKKGRINLCI